VLIFDTPWEKNAHQGTTEGVYQIVDELKKRNFDGAILFTVYSQNPLPSAMLCYLAGIPHVAGYCRENPYQLINHWIPDTEPLYQIRHEVDRQLDLVRLLGTEVKSDELSIRLPNDADCRITNKLSELRVDISNRFIIIHPGVSEAKRQYPVELFAKAAKQIADELSIQILLTGVEAEKPLTEFIEREVGSSAISLAGKLSLEELMALIEKADLVISNNTGPVHIAAALKTPVIVLYAMTNPQHTPWKVENKVLKFDVPKELQSKNVIISYAYEKSFQVKPQSLDPSEIVQAVSQLSNLKSVSQSAF
jgi:lipopolysaccharide heptosyltransferase II